MLIAPDPTLRALNSLSHSLEAQQGKSWPQAPNEAIEKAA